MTKDHFIPRFIIKNFADSEGNIRFYNKEKRSVSPEINHYNQLQKENFHSKKTLSELKKLFKHIEINPIFRDKISENLETALDSCLENPMARIVSKIIEKFDKEEGISLKKEEVDFVKEYVTIQHLRTIKFKMISKKFNEKFSIPSNFGDQLIEIESNRDIDIKSIIKKNNPHLNKKGRRELEKKYWKKLKKNPKFIEEIRERIFNESLDEMVRNAEKEIKEILNHLDRHSSDIINKKRRNDFFIRCALDKIDLKIIINLTKIPFVLGDTGVVIMADDPQGKRNLEVFLPIHPNLLIGLSETLPKNALIDENFVKNFNRISKEDSYKNIYSNSIKVLNMLKLD